MKTETASDWAALVRECKESLTQTTAKLERVLAVADQLDQQGHHTIAATLYTILKGDYEQTI